MILIRRKIRANSAEKAMRKIKKKYPRALLITYKYDKDFKFVPKEKRNYNNRTMTVVFVKDVKKIREDL